MKLELELSFWVLVMKIWKQEIKLQQRVKISLSL